MINFLKTRIRNLRKGKFFAMVNILSLSLGMFCFIIMSLYVSDELTDLIEMQKSHLKSVAFYLGEQAASQYVPGRSSDQWYAAKKAHDLWKRMTGNVRSEFRQDEEEPEEAREDPMPATTS